jgi:integrase
MNDQLSEQDERLRQAADQLFAEAKHPNDLTRKRLFRLVGEQLGTRAFQRVFPGNQFTLQRHAWLRTRIDKAIDTAFATAQVQSDVTLQQIADLAGCSVVTIKHLAGEQIRARRQSLATSQQQAIRAIEHMVEARIPLQEYTWARVFSTIGKPGQMHLSNELTTAFRDGREALVRYHEQRQQERIPGGTYACIEGGWINVDASTWRLPVLGTTLRREHLRSDIAAIAWLLLREEALTTSPSAHTLRVHYYSCISVAKLLGETIPDVRTLTLEALQQVWLRSEASEQMRKQGRTMLVRMLETLIAQGTIETVQQTNEYVRAIQWLEMIHLKEPASTKAYLSEAEFDALLDGCLEDTLRGLAYIQREDSSNQLVTAGMCTQEREAVLHWGIALFILVMAFTGLRRQSIVRLEVSDLAKLGSDAFALAWRHGKPAKQRIAVIPALIAEHIQHYIRATILIRNHLGTPQIFFARNQSFRWDQMTIQRVDKALTSFVSRHALTRNGVPLHLSSTLLRRTYVTRALYELPSIAALQAQLGHADPKTTLLYAQHDRYEHPAQVDQALDAFGRKVLIRWHKPLLLDDLPETERQTLLGARLAHEQDVGLCRHTCCVKLTEAHLSPCSLCEHLVSGPEYLVAWEREKVQREQQLERAASTPGSEMLFAQLKGQYDRFLVNYRFVLERSQK